MKIPFQLKHPLSAKASGVPLVKIELKPMTTAAVPLTSNRLKAVIFNVHTFSCWLWVEMYHSSNYQIYTVVLDTLYFTGSLI